MTVKTFKYLGPKQQQVLRELAEGWELDRLVSGHYIMSRVMTNFYVEHHEVRNSVVDGLRERGLIRPNEYTNRPGWVLTVRGKLEVEKMTKKGKR